MKLIVHQISGELRIEHCGGWWWFFQVCFSLFEMTFDWNSQELIHVVLHNCQDIPLYIIDLYIMMV